MEGVDSVRVAVRIRPLNKEERYAHCTACIHQVMGENQVVVGSAGQCFTFDHVFAEDSTQAEVYETCAASLVHQFLSGFNATIFAYGQTGSGKTYTMGSHSNAKLDALEQGIIPRCAKHIFDAIHTREAEQPDRKHLVKVQFLEIYGEDIIDLLDPIGSGVHIREVGGQVQVQGAAESSVQTAEDVMIVLEQGTLHRTTAATNMNARSSRSHAIFTVVLEQTAGGCGEEGEEGEKEGTDPSATSAAAQAVSSKFHFVDLAGSERVKRTGATGQRLREGININQGLFALGNVISALGDTRKRGRVHVPYRSSKLTRMLQDSLGGNSKTLMIACASPADSNFAESRNALRYANRARNIRNKPVVNRDPASARLLQLQGWLSRCAQELLVHRGDVGDGTAASILGGERLDIHLLRRLANDGAAASSSLRSLTPAAPARTVEARAPHGGEPTSTLAQTHPQRCPARPVAQSPVRFASGELTGGARTPLRCSAHERTPQSRSGSSRRKSAPPVPTPGARVDDIDGASQAELVRLQRLLGSVSADAVELRRQVGSLLAERDFFRLKCEAADPGGASELDSEEECKGPLPRDKEGAIELLAGLHSRVKELEMSLAEARAQRDAASVASVGMGLGRESVAREVRETIGKARASLRVESQLLEQMTVANEDDGSPQESESTSDTKETEKEKDAAFVRRQRAMSVALADLLQSISVKEEMLSHLESQMSKYAKMKSFYEKRLAVANDEVRRSELERAALLDELRSLQDREDEKVQSERERLLQRLSEKTDELRRLRHKQQQLAQHARVKSASEAQVRALNEQIAEAKRKRVELIRRMNLEKKRQAKLLSARGLQIDALKKAVRREQQSSKLSSQKLEKQQQIAKRHLEEAAVLRRKVQQLKHKFQLPASMSAEDRQMRRWLQERMREVSQREERVQRLQKEYEDRLRMLEHRSDLEQERLALQERASSKSSLDNAASVDMSADAEDHDLQVIQEQLDDCNAALDFKKGKILALEAQLQGEAAVSDSTTPASRAAEGAQDGSEKESDERKSAVPAADGVLVPELTKRLLRLLPPAESPQAEPSGGLSESVLRRLLSSCHGVEEARSVIRVLFGMLRSSYTANRALQLQGSELENMLGSTKEELETTKLAWDRDKHASEMHILQQQHDYDAKFTSLVDDAAACGDGTSNVRECVLEQRIEVLQQRLYHGEESSRRVQRLLAERERLLSQSRGALEELNGELEWKTLELKRVQAKYRELRDREQVEETGSGQLLRRLQGEAGLEVRPSEALQDYALFDASFEDDNEPSEQRLTASAAAADSAFGNLPTQSRLDLIRAIDKAAEQIGDGKLTLVHTPALRMPKPVFDRLTDPRNYTGTHKMKAKAQRPKGPDRTSPAPDATVGSQVPADAPSEAPSEDAVSAQERSPSFAPPPWIQLPATATRQQLLPEAPQPPGEAQSPPPLPPPLPPSLLRLGVRGRAIGPQLQVDGARTPAPKRAQPQDPQDPQQLQHRRQHSKDPQQQASPLSVRRIEPGGAEASRRAATKTPDRRDDDPSRTSESNSWLDVYQSADVFSRLTSRRYYTGVHREKRKR